MTPEYSLWLLPTAADAHWLDERIAALAPRFGTAAFRAHVTVQGDISAPLMALRETTHTLAATCPPLCWTVQALACSDHFYRSFYLGLAPEAHFDRLRDAAAAALGTTQGMSPFPHLSLAYGEPADAQCKLDLLAHDAPGFMMRAVSFDRLALVRSSKDVPIAAWRILDERLLSGA